MIRILIRILIKKGDTWLYCWTIAMLNDYENDPNTAKEERAMKEKHNNVADK